MSYVIRNNSGGYYRGWTGIGPSFGATLKETPKFVDKKLALLVTCGHSIAFVMTEVVSESTARRRDARRR